MATSSAGNPAIALKAATSSHSILFSSTNFCCSASDAVYAARNLFTSDCMVKQHLQRRYLQILYVQFFPITMGSLCDSIQLLPSLAYQQCLSQKGLLLRLVHFLVSVLFSLVHPDQAKYDHSLHTFLSLFSPARQIQLRLRQCYFPKLTSASLF